MFAEDVPMIEHTFRIVNDGKRTMKLIGKSCTCTCTSTALSQDVLRPGEVATLSMSIRTDGTYSGRTNIRCELTFDDGSVRTCMIAYESYPRIMVEKNHLDLGTFGSNIDQEAGSSETRAGLTNWVDLFAPAGRRLPTLRSIETPRELEATLVGPPETSTTNRVQRRRYTVQIKTRPDVVGSGPGGTHARTIAFLSDDGASTLGTVVWRQVERYVVTPSLVHFGAVTPGGSSRKMQVVVALQRGKRSSLGQSRATRITSKSYGVVRLRGPWRPTNLR